MSTRLSINLNDEDTLALRVLMRRSGRTATEVIHRALGSYKHVMDAQDEGKHIEIHDGNWRQQVTFE
jgi:hypothetical protein